MSDRDNPAEREAREFIERETEFHLGFLPTEQSHPKTRDFSRTVASDTAAGARMLLSVDFDIPPVVERVMAGEEYRALEAAVEECARDGRRICFTGCGATGRLAIVLEKMWRVFWDDAASRSAGNAALSERFRHIGDSSYSIMTGGDRALIRSVENFEDYISFGRRQVQEAGIERGDLLVAITEGGETSSVIGTALEAFERGARVFFVYNNPTDVLAAHIERSRRVIAEQGIIKLDLASGPMALSGSTRMQATTSEMLVVGTALERACARVATGAAAVQSGGGSANIENALRTPEAPPASSYADRFRDLVGQLSSGSALAGIAAGIDLEGAVYSGGGLVTYLCDEYLMDIISDTTERTPTFSLPPFRKHGDAASPPSWAFTKDPVRKTRDAWKNMLRRMPRGLDWTGEDYRAMGAADRFGSRPPKLDLEEILSYQIGNEEDKSRSDAPGSVLVLVTVAAQATEEALSSFQRLGRTFPRTVTLEIAPHARGRGSEAPPSGESIRIPLELIDTPMHLFYHLAVKLVFNTVSTATMGKLGRIRGNWMVQVDPTNKKLVDRSTRIISGLSGLPYDKACIELHRTMLERREKPGLYADSCVAGTLKRIGNEPSQT